MVKKSANEKTVVVDWVAAMVEVRVEVEMAEMEMAVEARVAASRVVEMWRGRDGGESNGGEGGGKGGGGERGSGKCGGEGVGGEGGAWWRRG